MTIKGKTILVTGGTDGIGRATVRALAAEGAHVTIVARNKGKAEALMRELDGVRFVACDLFSQKAIRAAASEILATHPRIDVLLNNAGGFFAKRAVTVDGVEQTFALNHLAYALLTDLLLERLKASGPARIVSVASGVHATGRLNFDDLEGARAYSGWSAYCNSKLANIAWTYALARRLEGTNVTANCLHPGFVASRFGHNNGGVMSLVMGLAQRVSAISETDGAKTSVFLASSPTVDGVRGKYFFQSREARSSAASHDEATQEKLWAVTQAMLAKSA